MSNVVVQIKDSRKPFDHYAELQRWLIDAGFEWNAGQEFFKLSKNSVINVRDNFKLTYRSSSVYRLYDFSNGDDKTEVMHILSNQMNVKFDPNDEIELGEYRLMCLEKINRHVKHDRRLQRIIDDEFYVWQDRVYLNKLIKDYKYLL